MKQLEFDFEAKPREIQHLLEFGDGVLREDVQTAIENRKGILMERMFEIILHERQAERIRRASSFSSEYQRSLFFEPYVGDFNSQTVIRAVG